MTEVIKMAMTADEISLKGKFFQALAQKAIRRVLQKSLKGAIGQNSKIVVDRLNMSHVDGGPVKVQLELSGEISEVDLLNLIDKLG